jgi:hypothetical protein
VGGLAKYIQAHAQPLVRLPHCTSNSLLPSLGSLFSSDMEQLPNDQGKRVRTANLLYLIVVSVVLVPEGELIRLADSGINKMIHLLDFL